MEHEINGVEEFESGFETMTERQLEDEIEGILNSHLDAINDKGMNSLGMLMGRAMAVLKGRSDGQKINKILKHKLEQILALREQ